MLFMEHNHYVGRAPVPLAKHRRVHDRSQEIREARGPRQRPRGVFASRDQRSRARPARARRSTPATRCSSTGLRETARPSSRRRSTTCSTARSPSRTRSKSEGSIIRLFDPVNHEPLAERRTGRRLTTTSTTIAGWIVPPPDGHGRRRAHAEQLELSYSPTMGFYRAPVQASPTAACSSSTTSAARRARRAICSTAGSCRSKAASTS